MAPEHAASEEGGGSNHQHHHHQSQLTPVAEKLLQAKCKTSYNYGIYMSYCPTMDLIALVTEDEELHVFRLNGQRVLGGSFSRDAASSLSTSGDDDGDDDEEGRAGRIAVRGLAWKDDGHLLAVACADNTIRIISSYSGKTVHHYSAYFLKSGDGDDNNNNNDDDDAGAGVASRRGARRSSISTAKTTTTAVKAKITCLGWGRNFTDAKVAQRWSLHGASAQSASPIEALLSANVEGDSAQTATTTTTTAAAAAGLLRPDLPRELALLDVESSLPKLSTLPSTGSDDDVFSSRASIDAIFHNQAKTSSDTVDVLLVGFDDGAVHLRIFDCFEIGTLRLNGASGKPTSVTALLHASDALSSTHALLTSVSHPDRPQGSLQLLTLDLRFITKSGIYLSLLASKTTQLQNLLRYINQVQRQIELEWKNAQELPARYMRNINEDLQEKCHCDFVTAVYHLVVTGDCFAPLKEFLVDIVGERGHKRWEKAVTTGYENVRRLTHECLLPALERCQVLLGRLTGLSKFQKLSDVLGLETPDLNATVQTLDCLYLLAHKILIATNDELAQFVAFSKWLRHEIDMQSAEPMSQTLEELMEKTDMIDHRLTLKYVQGPLTKSDLRHFIRQLPMMGVPGSGAGSGSVQAPESSSRWLPSKRDGSFYEHFKKLLQQLQTSSDEGSPPQSPKLDDLTKRLGTQFDTVFAKIALTQRRGILQRCALVLHPRCDETVVAMTMRFEDAGDGKMASIYIASRLSMPKHSLYIYRVRLDSVNGVSSTKETSIAALDLRDGEIRQIQFVEDDTIMLLWTDGAGSSYLLNIPFQPESVRRPATGGSESVSDFTIDYVPCESTPRTSERPVPAVPRDVFAHISLLKHAFTSPGPRANPVRIEVNGRQSRRAICVLYGDRLRYEILDMDAELQDDEDDGGEDEGGST